MSPSSEQDANRRTADNTKIFIFIKNDCRNFYAQNYYGEIL